MPKAVAHNRRSPHTVKRDGAQVPNLDRGFWMPFGVGNPGISLSEVMSRPYQNHGWSYACGRAITFNISRLSHVYAAQNGDKEQPLGRDEQLVQLFKRPNALMTEMQFWQAILLNLLFPIETSNLTARDGATLHGGMNQTGGTCFVIPWNGKTDAPAQLDKGEIPTELLPMGARFFSPILQNNKRGLTDVIGWNYKVPEQNGKAIPFKLNEILRIYLFNPYVWISGMAPFFAAQTAVDQDARASLMNTRFFENDATPGGVLSTKENLRVEQARDIRKEFQQTYGGIGNSRKLAVLWGGMEYQKMQLDHQEMQWKEQKDANLEELLATFGLNKIAVGRYENLNFATIREGRRCLWHDTYIPLDELIWDAINNQWFKNIGKGVRGYSDYDKVYALQEELKPKAEMASILVKDLAFSPTLACKKAGIKLTQEEIGKYPYLDERLVVAAGAGFGGGIPAANVNVDTADKGAKGSVIRSVRELTKVQRDERNAKYVKSVLDAGERNFLAILNRYFISQRNRTLDKVDEWTKKNTKGLIVKADYIDPRAFLLDQDKEFDLLMEIYHPAVKRQLELEKADLVSELGSLFSWDLTSDYVDHAVELRSDLLEGINTSTFEVASDAIAAAIKEGTDSGLTPQEMAKLIKQNVEDVYSVRTGKELKPHGEFDLGGMSSSTTIARTEMGSVASQARWDCYKQEGIEQQEWSTAEDDRVRESHMAVDGMKVKLGDVFGITGLRFPRDPLGDAGEVINCVLPGTIVSGPIIGALKTFYSGKAIELTTRKGSRLCVTVNHPIATDAGFLPAHGIRKGDNLICHCGDTDFSRSVAHDNEEHRETRVEDVYDAIKAHGTSRIHSPTSFDLDGDGEFLRGKIETVVGFPSLIHGSRVSDSALMIEQEPTRFQFGDKINLPSTDTPVESSFGSNFESLSIDTRVIHHAATGLPCARTLTRNSIGVIAKTLPFEVFRFGLASHLDVSRYEYASYNAAGYAHFLRDLILAFPGEVFVDEVVDVREYDFSGHVYDLQSVVGYFNSNNIISRNCRCSVFAYWEA